MAKIRHSATLDIGAKVSEAWSGAVKTIRGGTEGIKKEMAGLKEQQRGVTALLREAESAASKFGVTTSGAVSRLTDEHKRLKREQAAVEAELRKAQREATKLGKKGSDDVYRLTKEMDRLEREEKDVAERLTRATRAAKVFGVESSKEVAKLRREHEKLDRMLDKEVKRLKTLQAWHKLDVGGRTMKAVGGLAKGAGKSVMAVGEGLLDITKKAAMAGTALGAVGLGAGAWFTKSAIESAATIEKFETSLVTLEGSSEQAAKSMDWIRKFARETPYGVEKTAEAFTRLKAYGIDPTNGTLRTLGDTAASIGKDIMAPVEALADAVVGENERLKEFGIRAEKSGNKITYFYKDKLGKDVKKSVKKNSQEMIRETLMAIWNDKYEGAMVRQSKTWEGLTSQLSDQWQDFQVRIMRSGIFDFMKGELEGLSRNLDKWAADGTLQQWADDIAGAYRWAFAELRGGVKWVKSNWPEFKKAVVDAWPEVKRGFEEAWKTGKELAGTIGEVVKWLRELPDWAKTAGLGIAGLGATGTLGPLLSLSKVGWDIVAWLSTATGLTGALGKGLGKAGGAIAGAGKGAAVKAGGSLAGMAASAGGGLAGASTVAAGVLGAGALGYGVGRLIDKGTEWATGRSLSDRLGSLGNSDVEASRAALGGVRTTRGLAPARAAPSSVNNVDNRVINLRVDAKGADADEVAEKVERKLSQAMRRERLAAYGG